MKKILVPCDFSAAARHAYRFATEIAAINNGEVIVVKAIELPNLYGNGMPGQPYSFVDPVAVISEWTQAAEKDFVMMQKAIGSTFANVSFRAETGGVTDTILQMIQAEEIDLVVMGTNGAGGLKEFFVGSNTEKIVRSSPVPVFAIHNALHVSDVKNIIFPTSLDLTQNTLVEKIKGLQQLFHAVIHVLYINYFTTTLISDSEAQASLESYARFYNLENYCLHVSRSANLEEGIASYAERIPYSIIAMTTHGSKGLAHLLMGSIAEDVVNHVSEPVWTYSTVQS